MVVDDEAVRARDFFLPLLDALVVEFGDAAAGDAHHVVVVRFVVQLEHRALALEVMADDQPRALQLGQHAVHRAEADRLAVLDEDFVDLLGRHVPHRAVFQRR